MTVSSPTAGRQPVLVAVAWPYANGSLHAGHVAGAYLPADIFARFARLEGADVLFVSGSDCHGAPITFRADELGRSPEAVAAEYHEEFCANWRELGISFDTYTTTMTANHRRVVQEEFELLRTRGLISERDVSALYDPGAGRFLPDRYVIGRCVFCDYAETRGDQCEGCGRPLEPDDLLEARSRLTGNLVELRPTRHFFLELPKLEDGLRDWIATRENWRAHVLGETNRFLEEGLRDRAITRNLDWGVPIPVSGYEDRRIYVWFEAVTGYLSASIEWAAGTSDPGGWQRWWKGEQARQYYFLGKDNIPFHTIIWPAILLGRGDIDQLPFNVPANCFLNFSGQRASKSAGVGNLLNDLLAHYDADAIRYYIASIMPEDDDSGFDVEDLETRVNTELIGAWGNLVSRTFALVGSKLGGVVPDVAIDEAVLEACRTALEECRSHLWAVQMRRALRRALECARFGNVYINDAAPWRAETTPEQTAIALGNALYIVNTVKILLAPFVPFSSAELHARLGYETSIDACGFTAEPVPPGRMLSQGPPLFRKLGEGRRAAA